MGTLVLVVSLQLAAGVVASKSGPTNPLDPCLCPPAFHYECNNEADKQEFEKALETMAVSFSST